LPGKAATTPARRASATVYCILVVVVFENEWKVVCLMEVVEAKV